MAIYNPPTEILTIFNTSNWESGNDNNLTQSSADLRYLRLTGGTESGNVNFSAGLKSNSIDDFSGGTISVTANLNLASGNSYKVNSVDLIASQTGQSGKYLTTNGSQTSWSSVAGGTPAGSDTQIQYNNAGAFGASSLLTFNNSTQITNIGGGLVVDTNTLYVDATNNRVGILNASPVYALDVAGAVLRFSPDTDSATWTSFTAPTGISLQGFNASGFGYGIKLISASNRSSAIWFANASTGNRGNIIYSNSSDTMTIATGGTNRLTLTTSAFSSTLPFDCTNLTASGTLTLSGISASTQSNVLYYNSTTKAVTYGTVSATPGGSDTQIQFNDAGAFGGDAGLTYNKTTDTLTIAGGLIVDTNLIYTDTTNNRVGFNTLTPSYTLDVGSGDVNIATGGNYRINGVSVLTASTLGSGITSSSLTSLGTLSSCTISGNLTVDTNTLVVDATNNRVGIVNATPAYTLDLGGSGASVNVPTTGSYRINGSAVLTSASLGSSITASSLTSIGTLVGLNCSGQVFFTGLTNLTQSNALYFNSGTGEVTYGTAGGGGTVPGGSTTQVQFNDAGAFAGDTGLTFNKTSDVLTIAGGLTVATNKLFVDNVNARVGINTATPSYGLDVGSGDINLGNTSFGYKIAGTTVLDSSNLGSTITQCGLNVYKTSTAGDWKFGATNVVNNTNNGRGTSVGPYTTASGWTSSSTSHTFADTTYKVNAGNDNLCGIVTIFCASKSNNSTAVYQGVLSKRYLNALSLTQLSKTQNGITTFTVGNSGDSITVTTDSNCQCCLQFQGAL